jgi:hypothetical protein
MVLVFVTMLTSLCFSTLFYQQPMEPVCLDAGTEQCKTFSCPSCYKLHGTNEWCASLAPSEFWFLLFRPRGSE